MLMPDTTVTGPVSLYTSPERQTEGTALACAFWMAAAMVWSGLCRVPAPLVSLPVLTDT